MRFSAIRAHPAGQVMRRAQHRSRVLDVERDLELVTSYLGLVWATRAVPDPQKVEAGADLLGRIDAGLLREVSRKLNETVPGPLPEISHPCVTVPAIKGDAIPRPLPYRMT